MHRFIVVGIVSYTSAFLALAIAGVPLSSIAWIVPVTGSLSVVGWVVMLFIADQTYRPFVDAAAMMEGVCPECRTFNSLKEVTSADPNRRRVDCQACHESFRVGMTSRGIAAERLGKMED